MVALALAACGGGGGGGEDPSSPAESQVADVVETGLTGSDPADCTRLKTLLFAEQFEFSTGKSAIDQCRASAEDRTDDPDSVEVSNVAVQGAGATADVVFEGGVFDGSTFTLALIKDGDQWKLNRISEIQDFDFEAFQRAFVERLQAQSVPTEVSDCIAETIEQTDEDRVKDVLISGSEERLVGLFAQCAPSA